MKKLTKNQFRKMVQEEISKLTLEVDDDIPPEVVAAKEFINSGEVELRPGQSKDITDDLADKIEQHRKAIHGKVGPFDGRIMIFPFEVDQGRGGKLVSNRGSLAIAADMKLAFPAGPPNWAHPEDLQDPKEWLISYGLQNDISSREHLSEDNNYHQIGSPPNPANNLGMAGIAEDKSEGENTYWVQKYDEAAWEKLMDEMVGDERLTVNTANLLTIARHKLMPLTPEDIDVIELSHPTAGRSDKFSESKKITKGMVRKMIEEELVNVMPEERGQRNTSKRGS